MHRSEVARLIAALSCMDCSNRHSRGHFIEQEGHKGAHLSLLDGGAQRRLLDGGAQSRWRGPKLRPDDTRPRPDDACPPWSSVPTSLALMPLSHATSTERLTLSWKMIAGPLDAAFARMGLAQLASQQLLPQITIVVL